MSNDVYLGNPLLKKANTQIEFTQEQVEEFINCKDDPVYFANNYVKIVSLDEGLTQFNPYHFQEKLINSADCGTLCVLPHESAYSYIHKVHPG